MAPDPVRPLAGIHVLVIDDDERERFFVRAVLQVWGALVTAASVSEAEGAALAADVIVCDVPTIDAAGAGFLDGLLRKHAQPRRDVAMIALLPVGTQRVPPHVAARFHRHIIRPVIGDELRAMVRELVR
jgi:CheY-like chemotaxis protein